MRRTHKIWWERQRDAFRAVQYLEHISSDWLLHVDPNIHTATDWLTRACLLSSWPIWNIVAIWCVLSSALTHTSRSPRPRADGRCIWPDYSRCVETSIVNDYTCLTVSWKALERAEEQRVMRWSVELTTTSLSSQNWTDYLRDFMFKTCW